MSIYFGGSRQCCLPRDSFKTNQFGKQLTLCRPHFLFARKSLRGAAWKVNSNDPTPKMTHLSDSTITSSNNSSDAAKQLAGAKEARKRAKEKARSMHARIFRKKDEGSDGAKSHPTRLLAIDGACRNVSSKPSFSTPMKRVKKIRQSFRAVSNSSLSSISQDDVFAFHNNSGSSSLSSLTNATGSSGSLHASLTGLMTSGFVTQGPSKFETIEGHTNSCHAPRMPKRRSNKNLMEECNGSNDSLSLEDIVEESSHHNIGREWAEKSPPGSNHGVAMPVRHNSYGEDLVHNLYSSLTSEVLPPPSYSSSSSVFLSSSCSSSCSSSTGSDTFALHNRKL